MNLRKNLGRVASTTVATALLASVATVPAFAAGYGDYTDDPQATATVTIYKDITKPDNVYLPNEVFNFTIDDYGYVGEGDPTWKDGAVIDNVNNSITSAPGATLVTEGAPDGYATQEIAATGNNHTVRLADTLEIDLTATAFGAPGEYQFLITETGGTYENGLDYSAQNLILNVIVSRGTTAETENTLYIAGYELYNTTTQDDQIVAASDKTDSFKNDYAVDEDDKDVTKDFDLTKQVTGDFATPADEATHYEFKITIENISTEEGENKKYKVTMSHSGNDCATQDRADITEITENTQATFKLAEGDTFHIDGLTANDKITVVETKVDGFTTTYKTVSGETTFDSVQPSNGTQAEVASVSANYKTEFTNNKTASPATGIVMNVAPYALLVVVAVAGCFVFLRKRNED